MAAPKAVKKVASVVPPAKASREEALELIFAPLAQGDGFRFGAIGAPGSGKTHFMREVIAAALARHQVDLVVTHDVKMATPEFPGGTYVARPSSVFEYSEVERSRHLVFRGDPMSDDGACSVEEAAAIAKTLSRSGLRVLLNVGEIDNALSEGGRGWVAPSARWFSAQGRALRACLMWTGQQPKRTPDELHDQATAIAYFRLDARSIGYLNERLLLPAAMVEEIPRLERGRFVLYQPGLDWDGRIYPPGR
jgi:hypothetical protein